MPPFTNLVHRTKQRFKPWRSKPKVPASIAATEASCVETAAATDEQAPWADDEMDPATMSDSSSIAFVDLTQRPSEIETHFSGGRETKESIDLPIGPYGSIEGGSDAGTEDFTVVDDTVHVPGPKGEIEAGYDPEGKSSLTVKFGFDRRDWGWMEVQIQPLRTGELALQPRSFDLSQIIDDMLLDAI